MEQEKIQFTVAIIIGFVVMILFGIITVNIMQLIPIFGPFVGGIVAGIIAGKNFLNGAKAALIAGLLGAVAVSVDFIANTSYVTMAVPQYFQIFGVFFLVISLFYFSILAFLGGALGGAARGHDPAPGREFTCPGKEGINSAYYNHEFSGAFRRIMNISCRRS